MKALYKSTLFWWPVILKFSLLSIVAILTTFITQADSLDYQTIAAYTWWDWMKFLVPIAIVWGNTWIAFIDQAMAKLREQQADPGWKEGETI